MSGPRKKILIDAREFVHGRFTGIGRVLTGLLDALAATEFIKDIILAAYEAELIPSHLKDREKIEIKKVPRSFLASEKRLSNLTKEDFSLFISPYPKLPLFGCHCAAIHMIHDILDLTHPAYKKRIKSSFDGFRLKAALRKADLTWYDSSWSLKETEKYAGFSGRNAKVRYPGIGEKFSSVKSHNEEEVLKKYALEPGYMLIIGNGLPHKNLGVILEIGDQLTRPLVFVGVPEKNQSDWKSKYPNIEVTWIKHVTEDDLPPIIRGAFALAQPSTAEGYGYPPLEAMACGVPALVSDIPVLMETTGGNAFSAHPNDSKAWLEAFRSLEDRSIYRYQIEHGLKWVEPLRGRRAWDRYISDIKELLAERS